MTRIRKAYVFIIITAGLVCGIIMGGWTAPSTLDIAIEPPAGPDITELFDLRVGSSYIDGAYPNVAIVTLDKKNQFGGIWAKDQLDLKLPFSMNASLHLGHSTSPADTRNVADGMTFAMHNHSPALTKMIGGMGEGLGVWRGRDKDGNYVGSRLPNSMVIEFDTFPNVNSKENKWSCVDDPVPTDSAYYAHCALIYPIDVTYQMPLRPKHHINTFFFKPSQQWVPFEVSWKPKINGNVLGGTLTYTFAGVTKLHEISDVRTVFGGTKVWWGFTGATGTQTALQAAAFTGLPEQDGSSKLVAEDSAAGVGGTVVRIGDEITYKISYVNATGKTADLEITDLLPEGLEYVRATDENGNDLTEYTQDERSIVWKISGVDVGAGGTVAITAKVIDGADETVVNTAKLEWFYADARSVEHVKAENPVTPRKTVTVNYVDQEGNPLGDSLVDRVDIDTEYTYMIPDMNGYEFESWELNGVEQLDDPITSFTVTSDTSVTLIYVKKVSVNLRFRKTDAATDAPLGGAQFKLYSWQGEGTAPIELIPADLDGSGWAFVDDRTSAAETGTMDFDELSEGEYRLVEIRAPSGYQHPMGQWRFEITRDGEVNILPSVGDYMPPAMKGEGTDGNSFSIGNIAQYSLPEMGGIGTTRHRITGISLLVGSMLLAAIAVRCKRHRAEKGL